MPMDYVDASTEISVDFEKLDCCINEMNSLMVQLQSEEPSFSKIDFIIDEKKGSGMVCDYAYRFCGRTIEFYNGVYALVKGTIAYLKEIKKLQEVDQDIASQL